MSRTPRSHVPTPTRTDEDAPPRNGPPLDEAVPAWPRLREQIARAAEELRRLREENAVLRDRIQELERRPAVEEDDAFVRFDDDPAALRQQIERYIAALDRCLGDAPADSA